VELKIHIFFFAALDAEWLASLLCDHRIRNGFQRCLLNKVKKGKVVPVLNYKHYAIKAYGGMVA
jgi:hypothetical protein